MVERNATTAQRGSCKLRSQSERLSQSLGSQFNIPRKATCYLSRFYFLIVSPRRSLEDRTLVESRFFNRLQYIRPRGMKQFLLGDSEQNVKRAPSPRCLLQGADIQYAIAEVIVDFLIRLLSQKSLVCMNTIPSQQSSPRFWDEPFYIFEQFRCSLFWCRFRSNDFGGETALAVGFRTPCVLSMLSVQFSSAMSLVRFTISSILSLSW